jgi:hypothetical protein
VRPVCKDDGVVCAIHQGRRIQDSENLGREFPLEEGRVERDASCFLSMPGQ